MKNLIIVGLASIALTILTGCPSMGINNASGFCYTGGVMPSTIVGCNREKGTSPGKIDVSCGGATITCTDTQPTQRVVVPAAAVIPRALPSIPGPVPK